MAQLEFFFSSDNQTWYILLLYTCNEIHLIQLLFQLENTKSCVTLLGGHFSVSPSSMFYPTHKIKASTWRPTLNLTRNLSHSIIITKITFLSDIEAISLYLFISRIKGKELNTINAFSSSVVTCLHNVTSSNIWRDVICYRNGIAKSCHMISTLVS